MGTIATAFFSLLHKFILPLLKTVAVILIASLMLAWLAFILAGYFVAPLIPAVSPTPIASGYIGFFSGVIALFIIPLVVLIWLLFKVIWGYRVGPRIRRATFGVWIVTLILFATTALFSAKNFIHEFTHTEVVGEQELISTDEPILIDLSDDYNALHHNQRVIVDLGDAFLKQNEIMMNNVKVNLLPTKSSTLSLIRIGFATGSYKADAERNMALVHHNVALSDKGLSISDYTKLSTHDKFRRQCYEYTLKIPIGTKVKFKGRGRALSSSDFVEREKDLTSIYLMTDMGLEKMSIESQDL